MSDTALMQAVILQHANRHGLPCDVDSVRRAAQALYEAGFRMGAGTVDQGQNERLKALEEAVARIEGYMVIPAPPQYHGEPM